MEDDWAVPAPKEDPEARPAAAVSDGSGCPRLVPDGNFVEGQMAEDEGQDPDATPSP